MIGNGVASFNHHPPYDFPILPERMTAHGTCHSTARIPAKAGIDLGVVHAGSQHADEHLTRLHGRCRHLPVFKPVIPSIAGRNDGPHLAGAENAKSDMTVQPVTFAEERRLQLFKNDGDSGNRACLTHHRNIGFGLLDRSYLPDRAP